ncbi:MAG: 16S rRNA (guanine(527)-N(7))-methyltransferase RsmG [Bacilli bacterium]|nr:16S rRNA (guanine(527)-N(7))-methyltransferase RsmG [Bacilli bacterium]
MNSYLDKFNLSDGQKQKFNQYYQFLIVENKKINLTSIVEEDEVYSKHFYDSLSIIELITDLQNKSICDIGSGAGFPSIPLKILVPTLKVTIIEPTLKRVRFLQQLCDILKLTEINIINDRAENIIGNYREAFDVVVARAVANLPVILELAIPFIKVEGSFIAYKGQSYSSEIALAQTCSTTLEVSLKTTYQYELPANMGSRVLLEFTKAKVTKIRYPRKYADIKKKPL